MKIKIFLSKEIIEQIKNGSKENPTTARKLLNDIFSNAIKYIKHKGPIDGKTYCTATVGSAEFSGEGENIEDAREAAAIQVLNSYLNIKYPLEKNNQ